MAATTRGWLIFGVMIVAAMVVWAIRPDWAITGCSALLAFGSIELVRSQTGPGRVLAISASLVVGMLYVLTAGFTTSGAPEVSIASQSVEGHS